MSAKIAWKRALFFLTLVVSILPVFMFPLISVFNHQIYKSPSIQDGTINLAGYDLAEAAPISLDGAWEFYWQKWLVTDQLQDRVADQMLPVIRLWSNFELNGERLPRVGYASYRLVLENCPPDVELFCYVPYTGTPYQVYLDGQWIAGSGNMTQDPHAKSGAMMMQHQAPTPSTNTRRELVIEVSSSNVAGLYAAPILTEYHRYERRTAARYIMALVYTGILLATIGCYGMILCMRHSSIQSIALLVMDLLVFLRILMKDEFFGVIKQVAPFFQYYTVNTTVTLLTLFLPLLFLFFARDLLEIPIGTRLLRRIFIFELVCSAGTLLLAVLGEIHLQAILCMISYLPFIPVIRALYRNISMGVPYSYTVSVTIMWVLSCMLVANQTWAGLLTINVSMYPSTCFVIAIFLQVYIYVHRNSSLYEETLEAANLRLELKERETALLLSQIKPHFLYNALLAIQVLCTREPEAAAESVMQFSKYLRANMQSINSKGPIPFEQELEHIRNYAAIEKLRFQQRLTIVYQVTVREFVVPPLTVQPLVENAIKHGACKKPTGGTVTLRTYSEPEYWCIEVIDDGPGFDTHSALKHPKEGSYGLSNIAFRLQHMLGATIELESSSEKGTCARVRLPRRRNAT